MRCTRYAPRRLHCESLPTRNGKEEKGQEGRSKEEEEVIPSSLANTPFRGVCLLFQENPAYARRDYGRTATEDAGTYSSLRYRNLFCTYPFVSARRHCRYVGLRQSVPRASVQSTALFFRAIRYTDATRFYPVLYPANCNSSMFGSLTMTVPNALV